MVNSREIAFLIWGFLIIFLMFVKKDIRHSLYGIIKAFVNLMMHPIGFLTFLYIGFIFTIMYLNGLINGELIKDYLVWIIFGLFPLIYTIASNYKSTSVLKVVLGVFKFSIIPAFIISNYTLPLWVELVLVPFVTFVSMMIAVSEREPKYSQVHKLFNYILGACGITIIYFAFKGFFLNFSDINQMVFWKKMFLGIIGVSVHIPLLYLIQIYSLYEQIIIRTKFINKRDKFFALISIFKHCFFSKTKLVNVQERMCYRKSETLRQFSQSLSDTADRS